MVAKVDDEDYERLAKFRWYYHPSGYAVRTVYGADWRQKPWKAARMHREVICAPDGISVDHKNGDRLDNRRNNLRLATRQEQARNTAKWRKPTASRYKGVFWRKNRKRWVASIRWDGKNHELGNFKDEAEAALRYDIAALILFGDFARVNFPD